MKKKNVLLIDLYMELRKSWPRFLSILAMVFLGVAFFSGIRASGPDMKKSADAFYDRTNLMDIRIFGDLGLTDEDVEKVSEIEGVEWAEPGYTTDALWNTADSQLPVKFMSKQEKLDQITIKEGRLPEKEGECLVDERLLRFAGCKIGDKMEVSSGTEDKLSDSLKHSTYEIVGVGTSPYYLSLERGTTKIGNGELKGFVIVPKEEFTIEAYPQILISVKGAKKFLCYSDEYEDLIDNTARALEEIAGERCKIRYTDIKTEAEDKIADGEQEIKDAEKKLVDGEQKIEEGRQKLIDAKDEIQKNEKLIADNEQKLQKAKKQIAEGKKQLKEGKSELKKAEKKLKKAGTKLKKARAQYDEGKKEYDKGKKQLDQAKAQITAGEKQIAEGKKQLEQGEAKLNSQESAIEALRGQIAAGEGVLDEKTLSKMKSKVKAFEDAKASLNASRKQLAGKEQQIEAAKKEVKTKEPALTKAAKELKSAKKQLEKGEKEYRKGKKELEKNQKLLAQKEKELKKGEKEIKQGEKELKEGKQKLVDGKAELAKSEKEFQDAQKEWKEKKADGEKEIKKGKKELKEAREELEELEEPEWYILGRDSIQTYVEYEQDTERIEAIGKVFPVIFFLVAALVCLTTMTRMVQEDRTQIGVLKALGYTERQISMKYMVYAMASTLIGSLLGIVGGQKLLPVVVMKAYGIMYNNLPDMLSPLHLSYSLMAGASAFACVVLAAWSACHKTLKEVPANLMRPVAPKAGKRVFLERIPWVWKRINFSRKAAVRNLMRYKKRLAMTVFGIGGCMGILLVGFGLKDSILSIGTLQFGQVRLYDACINLEDDVTEKEKEDFHTVLQKDSRIKDWIEVKETSVDVGFGKKEKSAYLAVPKEPERLNDFIALAERVSGKSHHLKDDGIILTEKIASLLDVKEGDEVTLKEGDDKKGVKVKITAIVENYFYHYVFLSPALYEKLYKEPPEYTSVFTINEKNTEAFEEKMQGDYLEYSYIAGVSFVSGTAERVADMLKSMDAIIVIIVVAAGLLAFVVLYNLNNINISERKRELATLKVLGFYDGEVSQYIFRENIILTILGIIAGVGIGLVLHRFVILTAEIDMMMFGRNITLKSYLYSIGLTLLFSLFVNGFMHFKMKKIDMIESLKSVE